jgi:hypothetical protein
VILPLLCTLMVILPLFFNFVILPPIISNRREPLPLLCEEGLTVLTLLWKENTALVPLWRGVRAHTHHPNCLALPPSPPLLCPSWPIVAAVVTQTESERGRPPPWPGRREAGSERPSPASQIIRGWDVAPTDGRQPLLAAPRAARGRALASPRALCCSSSVGRRSTWRSRWVEIGRRKQGHCHPSIPRDPRSSSWILEMPSAEVAPPETPTSSSRSHHPQPRPRRRIPVWRNLGPAPDVGAAGATPPTRPVAELLRDRSVRVGPLLGSRSLAPRQGPPPPARLDGSRRRRWAT